MRCWKNSKAGLVTDLLNGFFSSGGHGTLTAAGEVCEFFEQQDIIVFFFTGGASTRADGLSRGKSQGGSLYSGKPKKWNGTLFKYFILG